MPRGSNKTESLKGKINQAFKREAYSSQDGHGSSLQRSKDI